MKKGLLVYLMCLVLLLTTVLAVGCNNTDPTAVAITSQDDVTEITAGQTLQLTAKVTPDAASQEVTWSTSNADVATISDSGLVTAVAQGNVTITAASVANDKVSGAFALVIKEANGGGSEDPIMRITVPGNVTEIQIGASIKLGASILPSGASQEVTWTSSSDAIATVDEEGNVTGVAEGKVTISATSKAITTLSKSVELTVAAANSAYEDMEYSSHADYIAAADGAKLKIKGVVTAITASGTGTGSKGMHYYVQDGNVGYYIYGQEKSKYPVEVGGAYAIGGVKTVYKGQFEIKDVEYCQKLDETITTSTVAVSAVDLTSLEQMNKLQGVYVSAAATISEDPTVNTAKKYSVKATIGTEKVTISIDPSALSAADFEAINAKLSKALSGVELQFNGVITISTDNNAALTGITFVVTQAEGFNVAQATPTQKVNYVKDALTASSFVETGVETITLAASSEMFDDVTITWASSNTDVIAADGAVTHGAQDTLVTLTATISHTTETGVTESKTFKVNVAGTEFSGTALVTLNFEESVIIDAGMNTNRGNTSKFKADYLTKPTGGEEATREANTFTIGANQWLLWNTLIAGDVTDHFDTANEGKLAGRAKAGADNEATGRIELLTAGNYDYVQFDAAVYNKQQLGICLGIQYKLEGTDTWVDLEIVASVDSYELTAYRFQLPAGAKTVAIYVVANSGNTVNIDNIVLGGSN